MLFSKAALYGDKEAAKEAKKMFDDFMHNSTR